MSNKKNQRMFDLFTGEFVQIILDKDTKITEQKNDNISVNELPILLEGYLVDEDDDYLFLGQQPTLINQAIKKEYVVHVLVTSEEESVLKIPDMDISDMPKDPKEYN